MRRGTDWDSSQRRGELCTTRMELSCFPCWAVLLQVLLIIIMADSGMARNINFNNFSPPVDPTPFPNSFKCFTCDHATDNYNCNRWAEDKWCPQHTNYCMTVHHFTSQGRSKSVTKRCAVKADCHAVGCRHHRDTGHIECISCCEGMVCNVEVPTNHTNAVFVIKQSRSSSGAMARTLSSAAFSLTFLTALLLS
ncbi:ly6/PLAUR domain-containing protein 6B isoform X1 [Acipenser ruthenus]|uniref:ly6/PLAUR domain-containing protein 6B isoform X1 n=2 Tax=Acipenser ruthenus TaxID=7906 RepID=UPI00155FF983|nr:ly6/PLAUR domain-containing protein 6B isoform X1 [Acipenser ruthenus]XP_033899316.2 ly6/PLAUR domain-containing protein 6B isoform X1 [Acipenser ruthenus]